MNKLIITVAPTGNVPTREMNPFLPLSPEEVAEDVYQCFQAGASIAHIHARNPDGSPGADPVIFQEIIEQIRARCNIIIQLSTGSRGAENAEKRGACIDLRPEMASLATGSSNFARSINANDPALIRELALWMKSKGVKPEVEVFDLSALEYAQHLVGKGVLDKPLHVNLVLGVPGSIGGSPRNLFFLRESLPEECTWTVTSVGKSHYQLSALAIVLGGHVRTGLEDVLELEPGKPLTNRQLVERVAALSAVYGRKLAEPDEARIILGLV